MKKNSTEKRKIKIRRHKLSQLYLAGIHNQYELAGLLGVDRSTVSRDLKAIQRQWRKECLDNINEAKGKELAKLSHLERNYWRSFDASKTRIVVTKEGINIPILTAGNPAFLSGILRCLDQRAKLLGLYAAQKINFKGSVENESELILNVRHVDIDERIKLLEDEMKRTGQIQKCGSPEPDLN